MVRCAKSPEVSGVVDRGRPVVSGQEAAVDRAAGRLAPVCWVEVVVRSWRRRRDAPGGWVAEHHEFRPSRLPRRRRRQRKRLWIVAPSLFTTIRSSIRSRYTVRFVLRVTRVVVYRCAYISAYFDVCVIRGVWQFCHNYLCIGLSRRLSQYSRLFVLKTVCGLQPIASLTLLTDCL